jgi:hypothetical protein
MPRKPAPTATAVTVNDAAIASATSSAVTVAENNATVSEFVGYDKPYDKLRVVQEAQFFLDQSSQAFFETGRRLLMLKERETFGVFGDIVENTLNLEIRTAQLIMQATTKFLLNPAIAANTKTFSHLGKSKLFQLMTLDDEILQQLTSGGTVANMKLADVETMSVRELKAMIRTLKGDLEETSSLLTAKDTRITKLGDQVDALQAKTAQIERVKPDQENTNLRAEVAAIMHDAEIMIINNVGAGFEKLFNMANVNDDEKLARLNRKYMSDGVAHLKMLLNNLVAEYELDEPVTGDLTWGQA